MNLKNKKSISGYSILEIIIYLSIFAAISVLVTNSFVVVMSSFSSIQTNHDLLNSGNSVMERMSREIRQSKSIDVAHSTFSPSSGSGVLRLVDIDDSNKYVEFSVGNNGSLNLYKTGTLYDSLLVQGVSVTNLVFTRISTTNSEAVKIEMTLQAHHGKINKTEKFYNTVIVRGGY